MEHIDIEVRIDKKMDVSIHIADIVEAINEVPLLKRWNYIAQILNGVSLNLSDTTEEQREIIKKYLTDKLKLF